jgi:Phage major capsid protein E
MADETQPSSDQPQPQLIPNIPAETGVYTTVTLIEGLRHRWAVPSFLRDMFFSARDYVDSNAVQVDTYIGGRALAPFVLPLEGQVVGRRQPYKTATIEAPIIAPAREITLRELGRPGWGETMYNYKSPEERFATLIASDSQEMDDEISRTEEYMCAGCMFGGKVNINYRNKTSVVLDYGFTNTTVLAKPWTDPTSDPLSDLRAAQSLLNANGYSGNVAIYSPDAWAALWANPNVQNTMKSVMTVFSPITGVAFPQTTPAGVAQGPGFTNPVMQNWVYSGTYTKNGVITPYVPKGQVLIGSSDVKNRIVYAQVIQIEQTDGKFHSYTLDRVPKMECNVNKNFFLYTLTSRPVPVPLDLMCWSVLKGATP